MKFRHRFAAGAAVCSLMVTLIGSAADPAAPQTEAAASPDLITRAEASQIALASLAECARREMPASVVVVDVAGFQRAAFSDDRAKFIGLSTSVQKAAAVLAFKTNTRALQVRAQSDKSFAEQYGKDERYHFSPGGLPVYKQGKLVAVLAVGGARNIDEDCAYAGLKTLSWATTDLPSQPAAK